ncbi:MAG: nodulation protein NfeD [Gammaproteobacteria bacterium]|nr:nodulation protein NfeD [Gammaproteobacteria bacterium]
MTVQAMQATSLTVRGGIGPAMADYVVRGIEQAQKDDLILIQLDTPGGLNKSTRQMIGAILTSNVPVVMYVAPSGARAASAGTYLLYASTVAVMAPGTHVGAASPVHLSPAVVDSKKETSESTSDKKAMNDAVAYIRSLAQLRNRNSAFAEQAVLDAKTLTASEALKKGVIDFIAKDNQGLFRQLSGMTVTQAGQSIKLDTDNLKLKQITPDWRMKLLWVVTDPTVAYLLLLLGIYGIFFEFLNPGFIAPGVIGAVAILVALYALQLLPINYAGLALIFLGIIFIIAEYFAPSFGVLGLGGTVSFILGSILLIDSGHESYRISWAVIAAMTFFNVILFVVGLNLALRSKRRAVQHGITTLIGAYGKALGLIDPQGQALIKGEIWSVYSKNPIHSDCSVKVIGAEGLHLEVEEQSDKGE